MTDVDASVDMRKVMLSIRAQMKTATGLPSVRMYENRVTERPDPPVVYLVEQMLPITTQQVGTGLLQAIGRTQYLVTAPLGSGTKDAEVFATELAKVFTPGKTLTSQGIDVQIERAERLPARQSEDSQPGASDPWWEVPVSILWRTFAFTQVP